MMPCDSQLQMALQGGFRPDRDLSGGSKPPSITASVFTKGHLRQRYRKWPCSNRTKIDVMGLKGCQGYLQEAEQSLLEPLRDPIFTTPCFMSVRPVWISISF